MPRTASRIDPADAAALSSLTAVGALVTLVNGARSLAPTLRGPVSLTLFGLGLLVLLVRLVAPRPSLALARPLHRLLTAVGDAISTVILTVAFVVLVWPYSRLLVLLGRLPPAEEPWPPPPGTSGWQPIGSTEGSRRASRPASFLAGITVRLGGAAALLRYLRDRPSAYLVPLALLLLLLGALSILGSSTGLGPLLYTLF